MHDSYTYFPPDRPPRRRQRDVRRQNDAVRGSPSSPTAVRRAEEVARPRRRVPAAARSTLELALYDIRLPGPTRGTSSPASCARRRRAGSRCGCSTTSTPPARRRSTRRRRPGPSSCTSCRSTTERCPGIPDLMHHKYVVRDREAVWTGSANWTLDSWTRQENVFIAVDSARRSPRAYAAQLRGALGAPRRRALAAGSSRAGSSSTAGPRRAPGSRPATAPSSRRRSRRRSRAARSRVRIASPVITSAPILATLAELGGRGGIDIAGVIDEPQTDAVYGQWATNGVSAWKIPLLAKALSLLPFSGKPSTPWSAGHASTTSCTPRSRSPTTRCSSARSTSRARASMNAENVLELRDAGLAERMAAFVDAVRGALSAHVRARLGAGDRHDLGGLLDERPGSRSPRARSARLEQLGPHPVEQPGPVVARRRGPPGGRPPRRSGSGSAPRTARRASRSRPAGDDRARVAHEHQLAGEEVVEGEADVARRGSAPARAGAGC